MSTPVEVQRDPHYTCMQLRNELNQAYTLLLKAEYIIRTVDASLPVVEWEKELKEWKEKRASP